MYNRVCLGIQCAIRVSVLYHPINLVYKKAVKHQNNTSNEANDDSTKHIADEVEEWKRDPWNLKLEA
jgi:hypothetical protein